MPDSLPTLVSKRDGRVVPFEADNISQALYAATEDLGRPSAFLARELTDGVLHFLAAEIEGAQASTAQIAEVVAKVVRELGQPALAQKYAEGQRRNHPEAPAAAPRDKAARSTGSLNFDVKDAPDAVVRKCLEAYSLHAIYGRDLAAAHEEGLIRLTGLEHPEELARIVCEPAAGAPDWLSLLTAPARTLVFDSPERALTDESARSWLRGLAELCEATGRSALLNLHVASLPAWASPGDHGPLFVSGAGAADGDAASAEAVLEEVHNLNREALRVNWHLHEADFAVEQRQALANLARRAATSRTLNITLDRPRRRVVLATGVDRQHAAALVDVGLDLPRFLRLTGVGRDVRVFVEKLPALARMAVRAGAQKRNFLRRLGAERPGLARGFLVERARLVVMPLGLDAVVQSLLDQTMAASTVALGLGRQIIEVLHATLQAESRAANLEIGVHVTGDEFQPVGIHHVHVAGALHAITGFGVIPYTGTTADELLSLLQSAWKKPDLLALGAS